MCVNSDGGADVLLLNTDGLGNFSESSSFDGGNKSSNHAGFGDLDLDGDVDAIIVSDQGAEKLINDGQGNFARVPFWFQAPGSSFPVSENGRGRALMLGDVDNDGDLDVVMAKIGEPNRLFINTDPYSQHGGTFVSELSSTVGSVAQGSMYAVLGDVRHCVSIRRPLDCWPLTHSPRVEIRRRRWTATAI